MKKIRTSPIFDIFLCWILFNTCVGMAIIVSYCWYIVAYAMGKIIKSIHYDVTVTFNTWWWEYYQDITHLAALLGCFPINCFWIHGVRGWCHLSWDKLPVHEMLLPWESQLGQPYVSLYQMSAVVVGENLVIPSFN